MDAIGNFLGIILTLGAIFIIYVLFLGGISKLFNSNLAYRGKVVARPDDLNNIGRAIKGKTLDLITILKKKGIEIGDLLTTNNESKITKLERIGRLKEQGHLTEEEYEHLKSEILKFNK